MLCVYSRREDSKPAHFLSLASGECVGCKRDFNTDRNNAVRIILPGGQDWSLAADTEPDANHWLQCLCQAVSEGLKVSFYIPTTGCSVCVRPSLRNSR